MSPFAVVVLAASLSLTFAKSVVTVARPGLCVVEASSSASALQQVSSGDQDHSLQNNCSIVPAHHFHTVSPFSACSMAHSPTRGNASAELFGRIPRHRCQRKATIAHPVLTHTTTVCNTITLSNTHTHTFTAVSRLQADSSHHTRRHISVIAHHPCLHCSQVPCTECLAPW
jgi:hypothetical protein